MRFTTILAVTSPAVVLGLGCGDGGAPHGGSYDRNNPSGLTEAADIEVTPHSVGFGHVDLGLEDSRTVTIANVGGQSLVLDDVFLDDPDAGFTLSELSDTIIAPDGTAEITVQFDPQHRDDVMTSLVIASSDPDEPLVEVPVSGQGQGPLLEIDPVEHDFGAVFMGCEDGVGITLSNRGNARLIVDDVDIDLRSDDLMVELGDGSYSGLPWEIVPGGSVQMWVSYAPMDELEDTALIMVESNDPDQPLAEVALRGTGAVFGTASESFTVEHTTQADVLFAIDRSTSMYDDISTFMDDFRNFTDGLGDAGIDYHVAAVVDDDGCINGPSLFVDNTFSGADVESTIAEMIDLGGAYGSNTEKAFTLWDAALSEAATPARCNEGLIRPGAALHLIGVSDEAEQSGGSYSTWLTLLQSYVGDPDDLVIHGIGGDYPDGCGSTDAYTGVYQASLATGGTLLSICNDMRTNMPMMSSAVVAATSIGSGTGSFGLGDVPVADTITVRIDGAAVALGWSYIDKTNEVTFDADNIPPDGSVVDIDYVVTGECDGTP